MGYYTHFDISATRVDNERVPFSIVNEFAVELSESSGYSFGGDLELWDIKWYSHNDDMIGLSIRHPEYVFKVEGYGEEDGDIWCNYYHNGKVAKYRAEIRIPDFDMGDLK